MDDFLNLLKKEKEEFDLSEKERKIELKKIEVNRGIGSVKSYFEKYYQNEL